MRDYDYERQLHDGRSLNFINTMALMAIWHKSLPGKYTVCRKIRS